MIGNNATVLPLPDQRSARHTLYFTRSELNQLLGLYSRNVARGIWRDYAIDHRDGQALFSVFRHTHESAAYTIVKSAISAATPGVTPDGGAAACAPARRRGARRRGAMPRRHGPQPARRPRTARRDAP